MSTTILWIQNIPDTYETVLSFNGTRLQSGTSKYIKVFEKLTSLNLVKYSILTPTLKRYTQGESRIRKNEQRITFVSGYFEETDQSDRKICYRALINDAENKEEECLLLIKEAKLYGCTISETDQTAFKKEFSKSILITLAVIIIIILIFIIIWIQNNPKMLSFFNMTN